MNRGKSSVAGYDAVVVGGGPAGLAACLSLATTGISVALLAPGKPGGGGTGDQRTAALFGGSISLLRNLGIWDELQRYCEPVRAIRIIDDTGGLLRAPEALFPAQEVGLTEFGFNVPNGRLNEHLAVAVTRAANIRLIESSAERIEISIDSVRLTLSSGETIQTGLVVGADGRNSPSRAAAQITTRAWSYPQSALVTTFAHTREHAGISTEFHRPAGPLTTVPLPGRRSSLVWVDTPEEAARHGARDDAGFLDELDIRLQGLLGSLSDVTARTIFPLSGLSADTTGANRVALVGESSHVFPPIGAQGLNLGLRDVAELTDCVADALKAGRDPGSPETLATYAKARAGDVSLRVMGVDVLNRMLITNVIPTHLARGAGIHLLRSAGPLRRFLVREGIQPSSATPRLMREAGP